MGSVHPYESKDGRRFKVRWRDEKHKQHEQWGFPDQKTAKTFLANLVVSADRGQSVDPSTARVTVQALGPAWLANQSHLKPSSYRPLEIAWRVHVLPEWGARKIGDIKFSHVQGWVTTLAAGDGKPRSATTVIRAHSVLAGILDVAQRDGRIATNPARGVKLPRKGKKRRAYLTPTQVDLLASNAGEHSTLILLLAYTGIRWGEATGLRVEHLDLLRRRARVEENAVKVGSQVIVGTPKSHEARSVPLAAFLAPLVAELCEGKSRDQLVVGDGVHHELAPYGRRGWFAAAVQQSQAVDAAFPRVTIHDLRHTAASLAISAGANVKVVQRMLGHASAAMTLDTYADLFEDDLDAVSDALDHVRARRVVG